MSSLSQRIGLLPLIALTATVAGGAAADYRSGEATAADSEAESLFVAPFTTRDFLEAVFVESERRRIYEEKTTGIFPDKKPRLVWAARDNGRDIDWRRAATYCDELELASFDDWRLPTLAELKTLLEPLARKQYSTPNEITLTACCPWSSTLKGETSAWNFNFRFRKSFAGSLTHTYDLRALCVRDWLESDGLPVEPIDELEPKKQPS